MIDLLLPFLMLGILLAAVLARPLARVSWLSLPVVLMLAGFLASEAWVALGRDTGLRWEILRDLVFYLLLPILIFEAAITVRIRAFRTEWVLIGALAVPLLLVAAFAAAAMVMILMESELDGAWAVALMIGAMICATDPTSVSGVTGPGGALSRTDNILEGESLINDATTITLFVMLSAYLAMPGDAISPWWIAGRFVLTLIGGALLGVALGWAFDRIIAPANDKVLTAATTLVLAFTSFWIGEHLLGLSGVVATVTAGLTVAWRQRIHRREADIAFALDSWRVFGFCAHAILFFLVGMSITLQMFVDHWPAMLIGIFAALASRFLIVFGALGPLSWLPGVERLDLREQNLLWWGGIRGAVAIALALSLSVDLPNWYLVQSTVYGVALFSLVFQAPLVPWLQRRMQPGRVRRGSGEPGEEAASG